MGLKDRFGLRQTATTEVDATTGEATGVSSPDQELRNFRKQHKWDPFLDVDKLDNIDEALDSGNLEKQLAVDESLIQEDSPYAEVRAAVSDIPVFLCPIK